MKVCSWDFPSFEPLVIHHFESDFPMLWDVIYWIQRPCQQGDFQAAGFMAGGRGDDPTSEENLPMIFHYLSILKVEEEKVPSDEDSGLSRVVAMQMDVKKIHIPWKFMVSRM